MALFLPFSDGVWRALALLALALTPYAAPVDVAPAASSTVAGVRLAVALLVLAAAAVVARWLRGASRVSPLVTTTVLASSMVLAFALPPARWPLARAVWVLAPILWIGIAILAAAAFPAGRSPFAARFAAVTAAITLGIVSMLAAAPRLRSRHVLLAANPGFEAAALEEALARSASGRAAEAAGVLRKCADANPAACVCLSKSVETALDGRRYEDVVRWTARAPQACFSEADLLGARAEALASVGNVEDALRAADLALRLEDRSAHAAFAKALAWLRKGDAAQATRFARQAIGWGRGTEGRVVLAGLLMQTGDLAAAQAELDDALAIDPQSVPALYDSALVAQKRGHFHAAREGYLRVLALDPNALDARYNLAVLTHSVGADAEARHHVDEMAKIAPGDPRIAPLLALVSSHPEK